ncbi:MAG: hypothetical protein KME49_12840 [Brasilonema octagenarum HA4186-MV1]|jgi:hypothetical protein|uniref:SH3b domain-containing protein n=2 Tax=Brasilonema TaxID=383614 RepID=A0A856MC23_9CYAN|nr:MULTISPECIES: hypothetical protein [Brasilonema]MBW4626353.1 hypothetical protein [Brasilonema octagenarum HA4186-MV1]NMF65653.1 hypothetical protein [Brasilonema octagenarum UFV-OR1]QDL08825.1 hypothetical protein DP114_13825 [Brasilonema sennae CENA114]QDL15182.1 hypothetical protein DP113_13765 [Brasilonema octagenarum UFV-E1]
MKKIIVGTLLALPLAIASIPTQASALEIRVDPGFHARPVRQEVIASRYDRRRWVPAHWERRNGRRVWIRGHYVRY